VIQRWTHGDTCGEEYNCEPKKDSEGELVLYADVERLERKLRKARPAKCSTCKEAKFSRDLKRAAALAKRLTKEKQEEFDIATGYHKKWVAAERQLAEARERLQLRENDEGIWLHVKTAKAQGAVLVAPKDEPRGPIVMATLRAALGEGEGEGKGG